MTCSMLGGPLNHQPVVCCVCRVPIEGRSMQDLRMRIMAGKFAPVPAGRYSTELINYCHGLLSTDPKRR